MPLIIEDGTLVPSANSYITVQEARDFASSRGITLPADDATVEASLVSSFDYLQSYELKYQGLRTDPSVQNAAFPREGVVLFGADLDNDVIPQTLKDAQSQLVIEVQTQALMPSDDGRFVTREKVDVLEVQYAEPLKGASAPSPNFPAVEAFLEPLLKSSVSGLASALTTIRI